MLQGRTSDGWLHTGIDILGEEGEAVYSVSSGFVAKWNEADDGSYLCVSDCDTSHSSFGWLYGHLDPDLFHREVGKYVQTGDLIGYLHPFWGIPHLHWIRTYGSGSPWEWTTADNPWLYLEPKGDTVAPSFINVITNQLFGFKANNVDSLQPYLGPDSLFGDVDIIAQFSDQTGYYSDDWDTSGSVLIPMEVWFEIHGGISTQPVRSFLFAGVLQYRTNLDVWYTFDTTCFAAFVLTNTDGDSLREESDYDSCWHTADFPDGDYWVVVIAKDAAGNSTTDSMQARLCNGVEFDKYEIMFDVLSPVVRRGEPLTIYSQAGGVLRIYDVSGKRRYSIRLEPSTYLQEINIGELTPGVYFIRIDAATPLVQKLIVLY